MTGNARRRTTRRPRAGDTVKVGPAAEIRATLDSDGTPDRLPSMPQRLQFSGSRFTVDNRADTACCWKQLHRLEAGTKLEAVRCRDSAHGGFQAGCFTIWKAELSHLSNTHQGHSRRLPRRLRNPRRSMLSLGARNAGAAARADSRPAPGEETRDALERYGYTRGLSFDPEMLSYRETTRRVQQRVNRIIHDRTGQLLDKSRDCLVVDGAVCRGPRTRRPEAYRREAWLSRPRSGTAGTETVGRAER